MRRTAALLALAATTACGSGSTATPPSSTTPSTTTTTTTSTTTTTTTITTTSKTTTTTTTTTSVPPVTSLAPGTVPEPLGADLVGRWAHYDVVAYEDGTLKTLIISYGFNDFELDGDRLVDQASFCFSEQRTDQPIETSLSDAATQAIRPPATPIEVAEVDGTIVLRRSATPTPVGIRLDDPANEPLPTDPNDPRIVDDDGDGKPGITVSIRVTDDLTGELYIARREIFAYEATQTDADTFVGAVTDDSEQLVIGASDPVFDMASDWVQHPDPSKSPIVLRRVTGDWDCDRLRAERDALFPPTPEVDW